MAAFVPTSVTHASTLFSAVVVAVMRAARNPPGLLAIIRCKCRSEYFNNSVNEICGSSNHNSKTRRRSIITTIPFSKTHYHANSNNQWQNEINSGCRCITMSHLKTHHGPRSTSAPLMKIYNGSRSTSTRHVKTCNGPRSTSAPLMKIYNGSRSTSARHVKTHNDRRNTSTRHEKTHNGSRSASTHLMKLHIG